MLSLSVSCIHLELSAAKSLKEQALLVLSMILFQGGRKMAELCAMRMELDYAFVEFPLFSRGKLARFRAVGQKASLGTPQAGARPMTRPPGPGPPTRL
jgi:hypothetical protein